MLILLVLLACTSSYPENSADTAANADTGVADTGTDDSAADSDTEADSAVDSGSDDSNGDTAVDSGSEDSGADDTDVVDTGSDDTAADTDSDVDSGSDGCTDADSDGYCSEASGGSDCDDFAGAVNPGKAEIADNGVDENCDGIVETTEVVEDTGTGSGDTAEDVDTGTVDTDTGSVDTGVEYVDADSDGYGSTASGGDDCDDANSGISPGAIEIADDGIDQDCSGADEVTPVAECITDADCPADACYTYFCGAGSCFAGEEVDVDGDGYGVDCGAASGGDCDDTDADINPGASEIADDGIDQDCDGSDSTLATLQDEARCIDETTGVLYEACVVDVDGDGIIETLLMADSQWTSSSRYGDDSQIVEYGSCAINGDTVSTNSVGYYVIDFTGLSTCTTQMSLVQSSYTYWWQNLSFCTDGSDIQGICENMGGANYLIGLDWDSSDGFQL